MDYEDMTGEPEAELEARINDKAFFTIDSDRKALKAMFRILGIMQKEIQHGYNRYFELMVGQWMEELKKYLYGKEE